MSVKILLGVGLALTILTIGGCNFYVGDHHDGRSTPATPEDLTVGSPTTSSLTVGWSESDGAGSYDVYRDVSSTGSFATQAYTGSDTSFTDTGLESSTTYYYKVRATSSAGSSAFSSPASGKTVPMVYSAGYYWDGTKNVPCYWAGSVKTDLSGDGVHDAYATSIFVSDGTVYSAGYYSDGSKLVPCFWTGTARTDLPASTADAYANSLSVSGGSVYVAGYYGFGVPVSYSPCYWKDGGVVSLAGSDYVSAYAYSVFVSDSSVYSAGYYDNGTKNVPCYWTNATRTDLSNVSSGARANSVFVSSGTVYSAGWYKDGVKDVPCYWSGSMLVPLSGDGSHDARVLSVAVSDTTVYSAGWYYNGTHYVSCYWKSSTKTDLPGGCVDGAPAASIFVLDGTVYTGGWYSDGTVNVPCYWMDTTRTDLAGDGTHSAYVKSIYVK